jgi:hypothetical protein
MVNVRRPRRVDEGPASKGTDRNYHFLAGRIEAQTELVSLPKNGQ